MNKSTACTYNCILVDPTFIGGYLEYGVTANITAFHILRLAVRGSSGFDSPYSNYNVFSTFLKVESSASSCTVDLRPAWLKIWQ